MKRCKIRYIVAEEIKKSLGNSAFWISVVAAVCILFCVTLYNDSHGACISPAQIMFQFSGEEKMSDTQNSFWQVMYKVCSGYFIVFAPVLVGVAVIPMLCSERECGVFRYAVVRTGKKKQAFGKLLASMLCGGLALLAGYVLFGMAAYVMLPHGKDYPGIMLLDSCISQIPAVLRHSDVRLQYAVIMGQMLFGVFCFGAANALWTYLVSVFVKNKYIAACIPYMFLNFISDILAGHAMEELRQYAAVNFIRQYVMPVRVLNIGQQGKQTICMIAVYAVMCLLMFLLYCMVLERRTDCGK